MAWIGAGTSAGPKSASMQDFGARSSAKPMAHSFERASPAPRLEPMPSVEPESYLFADDGTIPNNPRLPFLVYRDAVDLKGEADPEERIERVFASNGWGDNSWRNGVYPYPHYHSTIHEVWAWRAAAPASASAAPPGEDIELNAGDVCVLPAGTGHQGLWTSPDLMVIGAYPASGQYDLCLGSKAEYARAVEAIPEVPLPGTDPVFGRRGWAEACEPWCR